MGFLATTDIIVLEPILFFTARKSCYPYNAYFWP
jgi:hypothetical protein